MDISGICYYELLDHNEKVDEPRYLKFLENLMSTWRGNKKRVVWLLDDNAKLHRTSSINSRIQQNNIRRWLQPAYYPDLSPRD